mmetsp:Transcript_46563/g.123589  ORF Transcript_46563/g.123589 Transcript_46563/m.123589 type:complete len:95 (+) Transcript_46563:73-357(+)
MTDTSSNVHVDEAPSSDRTSADGVSAGTVIGFRFISLFCLLIPFCQGFTTNPEAPLLRRQTTRFQRLSSGPAHQVSTFMDVDDSSIFIHFCQSD